MRCYSVASDSVIRPSEIAQHLAVIFSARAVDEIVELKAIARDPDLRPYVVRRFFGAVGRAVVFAEWYARRGYDCYFGVNGRRTMGGSLRDPRGLFFC